LRLRSRRRRTGAYRSVEKFMAALAIDAERLSAAEKRVEQLDAQIAYLQHSLDDPRSAHAELLCRQLSAMRSTRAALASYRDVLHKWCGSPPP
jgi:hypothetical protein